MLLKYFNHVGVLVFIAVGSASTPAFASASLIAGLGGPVGYGSLTQLPNDDSSSNALSLPFTLNFFGNQYNSFYANNNGNITFNRAVSEYTPRPFPISSQPMIAPYWGDVDTRNQPGGGAVYYGSPNSTTAVITWNDVGFFQENNSKTNNFQLVLSDRSDTGTGNFDIEFRYNRLEWTSGDASQGVDGLGGIAAQAGFDAGDFINFGTLPGSRTDNVLELQNSSNIGQSGVWLLTIRNGETTPGETPQSPLLPTSTDAQGFQFDFGVAEDQLLFIDPLIAVGYNYIVNSGPNIGSALFPTVPGDTDGFDLFGFNSATLLYDIALGHADPGQTFSFGNGGVSRFGLRDIEASPFLDPANELAFVTGLTFVGSGAVNLTQSPVTEFVEGVGGVPEPSSWAMLIAGFGLVGATMRRRRTVVAE